MDPRAVKVNQFEDPDHDAVEEVLVVAGAGAVGGGGIVVARQAQFGTLGEVVVVQCGSRGRGAEGPCSGRNWSLN